MIVGKIVSSTSHANYLCQVARPGEAAELPRAEDYGFGRFVGIEVEPGGCLVGVIYDTTLLNPEFGNLGPRLSPMQDMAVFTPDYVAERMTLVAIAIIGALDAAGTPTQGVPTCAAGADARVRRLSTDDIRAFHRRDGGLRIAYLPQLVSLQSPLAFALAERTIETLRALFPDDVARLDVLRTNLAWRARVQPIG